MNWDLQVNNLNHCNFFSKENVSKTFIVSIDLPCFPVALRLCNILPEKRGPVILALFIWQPLCSQSKGRQCWGGTFSPFHLLWSQYVLSLLPELMGSCSWHRRKMPSDCNGQHFRFWLFAELDSWASLTIKPGWIFCQCDAFGIINRPVIYLKDVLIS